MGKIILILLLGVSFCSSNSGFANGIDSWVNPQFIPEVAVGNTGDFTIEIWWKSFAPQDNNHIFGGYDSPAQSYTRWYTVQNNAGFGIGANAAYNTLLTAPGHSIWRFLTWGYSAATDSCVMTVYDTDGRVTTATQASISQGWMNYPAFMFCLSNGDGVTPGEFIKGNIAEIRVWKKWLSANESRGHMYRHFTGKEDGLVFNYTFDETYGGFKDHSGHGYDSREKVNIEVQGQGIPVKVNGGRRR